MRSTTEWQFWGQHDPMWAVATWKGREHEGPHPWTIDDFRESGRSDCADIMRHWNHYGRMSTGICIEIGCGSGRPTSALLDHFDRVFGIDVSPDQVELARQVLGDGVSRVDFSDLPSIMYRTFDFVRVQVNRAIGRRRFMELRRYPTNRIVSTLNEIGFEDVEVRIFRITAMNFRQSFFFSRKPSRR